MKLRRDASSCDKQDTAKAACSCRPESPPRSALAIGSTPPDSTMASWWLVWPLAIFASAAQACFCATGLPMTVSDTSALMPPALAIMTTGSSFSSGPPRPLACSVRLRRNIAARSLTSIFPVRTSPSSFAISPVKPPACATSRAFTRRTCAIAQGNVDRTRLCSRPSPDDVPAAE